jgi:phosphoglycerate kinase
MVNLRMAFTFLKVLEGMKLGNSLYDQPGSELVPKLIEKAKLKNVELFFPVDFKTADKFDANANTGYASKSDGIPDGWMGLDCSDNSNAIFRKAVLSSKTILWNGPAGVFEFPAFSSGTNALLDACLEAFQNGATTIVGGGDTATAVANAGKESGFSHVSTGGGASLELLEGKALPGVIALSSTK